MKHLLTILLFLPVFAFGQRIVPFGATRAEDTSRTTNLRVDGLLRFLSLANSDTNKVLSFDASGFPIWVTKGSGGTSATNLSSSKSGNYVTVNSSTGTGTTFNIVPDSLNGQPASYYLNRANQTGTQAQSTITGLSDTLANRVPFGIRITPINDTLQWHGDSWTDISFQSFNFASQVADSLVLKKKSLGLSSSGAINMVTRSYTLSKKWKRQNMALMMIGLNDYGRTTLDKAYTDEMLERSYEAQLNNLLLDTAFGGNRTIRSTNVIGADLKAAVGMENKSYTISSSDSLAWYTAAGDSIWYTFTGTNVVVGYIKYREYGDMEVRIDGKVVDTIRPSRLAFPNNSYFEAPVGAYPASRHYTCPPGSHRLTVISLPSTIVGANNVRWAVDYVGHLQDINAIAPILIGNIQYVTDQGVNASSIKKGYDLKQWLQNGSYIINKVVNTRFPEYKDKIRFFDPNRVLDADDFISDGVHLTSAGHTKLANEVLQQVRRYIPDKPKEYHDLSPFTTLKNSTVTATQYDVVPLDDILFANTASNSITFRLPSTSVPIGKRYFFKKTSASNSAILDPFGSVLIEGATSYTFTENNRTIEVYWDGSSYRILNYDNIPPGGGSGTVTSFSASSTTLSTSVATATTTPALTVNLSSIGAGGTGNTITYDQYGRVTGSSNADYATNSTVTTGLATKENTITGSGNALDYFTGNKTFAALPDQSATNEIQTISVTDSSIGLSLANTVGLGDLVRLIGDKRYFKLSDTGMGWMTDGNWPDNATRVLGTNNNFSWAFGANGVFPWTVSNSDQSLSYSGTATVPVNLTTSTTNNTSFQFQVTNTRNSSSSGNASMRLQVGGANAGDPYVSYSISGVDTWVTGVDNSASDIWGLWRNTTPGTNPLFTVTTAGNTTITGSVTATNSTTPTTGTASGNGSATQIDITLPVTPTWVSVQAGSAAAAGITYATPITNGVRIFYTVAPATGTNNLTYYILYR